MCLPWGFGEKKNTTWSVLLAIVKMDTEPRLVWQVLCSSWGWEDSVTSGGGRGAVAEQCHFSNLEDEREASRWGSEDLLDKGIPAHR